MFGDNRIIIRWDVVGQCNLNCVYCQSKAIRKKYGLEKNKLERLLDNIADGPPKTIFMLGGEPTMYEFFEKLCQDLTKINIHVMVNTNGIWKQPNIVYNLLGSGAIKNIAFSIDSFEENENSVTRGTGVLKRVLQNLRAVRKLQDKICDFDISIGTVFTKANMNSIHKIIQYAEWEGVSSIVFYALKQGSNMAWNSHMTEKLAPLPSDAIKAAKRIFQAKFYSSDNVIISDAFLTNRARAFLRDNIGLENVRLSYEGCNGGKTEVYMTPEGDLYPCTAAISCPLGIKYECNSIVRSPFMKIYNSSGFYEFRQKVLNASHCKDCNTCNINRYCGPCLYRKKALPMCDYIENRIH